MNYSFTILTMMSYEIIFREIKSVKDALPYYNLYSITFTGIKISKLFYV